MLIIKYSERGDPVPDHECEELIMDSTLSPIDFTSHLNVSTENVIEAARALIAEGKITPSNVKIFIFDTELEVNEYGEMKNPKILPDHSLQWIRRVVMTGIERRKKLREKSNASDSDDNKISVEE
jgi:hypothetical protein